jgi:flagellin-like protein
LEDTIVKINYAKSGKYRGIFKNDSAVSPVIAVILMVAITVVMAAIVSTWSSGVKAPTAPTTVGLDISRENNNITIVVTSVDPSSSAPIPALNATYSNQTTAGTTSSYLSNADVGQSITLLTNEAGPGNLVVVAKFKDGSKKVLYSRDT